MKLLLLIILSIFNNSVLNKYDDTITFIKEYIINESKPTLFVCTNLCWKNNEKFKLYKELLNANIRSSSVFVEISNLQDHSLLFFVDLDCPQAEDVLNVSKYLRSPYRWLAFHNQNKYETNIQILWDLPLLADSDFVLAERNENNFTLSELYKPSSKGPTYSNPRGYYNGSLVDTRSHRELYRRRKDVMGHPLTMANVIQDSNSSMYHVPREDRLELQHDAMAKLSWMNVEIAFKMLNATPRYIFSYEFGYKKNGKWYGMINDLITGKADLGTNCVARTDRFEGATFTDSIAKFSLKFVFRKPPLSYVTNIFTLPFAIDVWIALISTLIFSIFTICLTTKWETCNIGTDQSQLDGSVGDAMLLTLSAFSQQGCSKSPRNVSGQIMLWVVFTAFMALYAAYSANIVVLLQASSSSINTLDELANSKMTIAALDVDYNHILMKAHNDPVKHKIYRKIEPKNSRANYYDLTEGVERIRRGLFAFHGVSEQVFQHVDKTFMETEKCDLVEVGFLDEEDPFVPVYKHSPYLELLRVTFKRIHESGIRMALNKRVRARKPNCAEVAAFSSVSFINIQPLVFFMLIGVAVSIVILLTEIVIYKTSHITQEYNLN